MMQSATIKSKSPLVVTTVAESLRWVRAQQAAGRRVGLVPTMGALHSGHLSLVQRSSQECDTTVVSIYVNPKQFAPQEDFAKYPRNLDTDMAMLAGNNVGLVFAPSDAEMYPANFSTYVEVAGLTQLWDGALRPSHFRGVTTVVLKLFQIAPADRAYFGQKDYQQFVVVRRMVADLNIPIELVVCPTVREADGLAMSSRNQYLSDEERRRATVLSQSLRIARQMFIAGERSARALRDIIRKTIESQAGVALDYAAVVDADTLAELTMIKTSAVALVAARVGNTRLIDNELLSAHAN